MLLPLVASALPFVPTTDPESASTKWYYLTTNNYYVVNSADSTKLVSAVNGNSAERWCFVGDASTGYKLYNAAAQKYLGDNAQMFNAGSKNIVYYQERSGNTFYLMHPEEDDADWNVYLYYDDDFHRIISGLFYRGFADGCFEVEPASDSGDNPPQPGAWTRYDSSGVGYAFLEGGASYNSSETSKNLVDGNASTKYYGNQCWVKMQASSQVAVKQYSIVTANDSREQYYRAPRTWTLKGSNDYVTWVDIDVRDNHPMPFENFKEVVFKVNDTRKFRYFMLEIVGAVQLSEIWINEQSHNWNNPSATSMGCGYMSVKQRTCSDCHAHENIFGKPSVNHNYQNGVCTNCGAKQNETVLLYDGQHNIPLYVKGKHGFFYNVWPEPQQGWATENFDDSMWDDIPMPLASEAHSNGPFSDLLYNANWYNEYNCYWLRRTFTLNDTPADATYIMRTVHDDNMQVFVNGQKALDSQGWTETPANCTWATASETFELPANLFKKGKNVLAIYIQQNWGGAYFDCSLTRQSDSMSVGDVDGNGEVNGNDLNTLINILLGKDNADNYDGRANVDGQGGVDGNDLNALINILLGK